MSMWLKTVFRAIRLAVTKELFSKQGQVKLFKVRWAKKLLYPSILLMWLLLTIVASFSSRTVWGKLVFILIYQVLL